MISARLLRVGLMVVSAGSAMSACDKQGATVGPYPSTTTTATPSASPSASVSPTPTPAASASATAVASASASPTAVASASASPGTAIGAITIVPDPINFGLLSVLGSTQTAQISQPGYSGPFTLPANPVICANGITNIPVTASISGSTLSVALGLLGVTGSCTITVDGAPGTSGTETVNLTVPVGTPPSTGPLTFSTNPIVFNVLNGVLGNTGTTTVSEAGYNGPFTLPANAVSCPFNLVPLTGLAATIAGDVVTVTTGTLNANLLGSCNVTVDDANGNSGAFVVNFQLL